MTCGCCEKKMRENRSRAKRTAQLSYRICPNIGPNWPNGFVAVSTTWINPILGHIRDSTILKPTRERKEALRQNNTIVTCHRCEHVSTYSHVDNATSIVQKYRRHKNHKIFITMHSPTTPSASTCRIGDVVQALSYLHRIGVTTAASARRHFHNPAHFHRTMCGVVMTSGFVGYSTAGWIHRRYLEGGRDDVQSSF